MHRVLLVHQSHDFPFLGPCSDFQAIRQRFAFDDERMIARRLEGIGHIGENALPLVMDRRGLAVHEPVGTHDITAVDLPDRLMPEANAENRCARAKFLDQPAGNARLVRCAGTR